MLVLIVAFFLATLFHVASFLISAVFINDAGWMTFIYLTFMGMSSVPWLICKQRRKYNFVLHVYEHVFSMNTVFLCLSLITQGLVLGLMTIGAPPFRGETALIVLIGFLFIGFATHNEVLPTTQPSR